MQTFEMIRRWRDWMAVSGRVNANTAQQYAGRVIWFLSVACVPLDQVSEDDIVQVLADMTPHGDSQGSLIRALHSFYAFASARWDMDDPSARLAVRSRRPGAVRHLTDTELGRLLIGAEQVDPRAAATFALMFGTGARISSVAAALPEDVDLERRVIHWRFAKGEAPYSSPLEGPTYEAAARLLELKDWTPARHPGPRPPTLVGVGKQRIRQWMDAACAAAGLDHITPHDLRRTFATKLADDPDVSLDDWTRLMNHRDPSQFRRYAAGNDSRQRAAAARLWDTPDGGSAPGDGSPPAGVARTLTPLRRET